MNANSGSVFTFFIQSGLHAGTVQRLAPGIYTIGSELEADIILSDPEIEAVHLIVELDYRGLRLEPLQGAIAVEGEGVALEPGGERHLSFPGAFSIGGTSIKISAPKDVVQTKRRMRIAMVAAGLAVLAMIGFHVLNPTSDSPISGPSNALMQPADSLTGQQADTEPEPGLANGRPAGDSGADGEDVSPATPGVTLDQAAAALRERLETDDLPDIKVKTAIDRIVVRGEAEPERMGDWQDIRIWFDGAFGREFLLVAEVEPAEKEQPPSLAIEAVWSGDNPYLIAGGQRFAVGAHVGDGWMIDQISADEVTFKRGDKSFSLTL
ncbi:MAG: FHA domain-containing protein [Pseudomonadota bacterium]